MSAILPLLRGLKEEDIPTLDSNAANDIATLFGFAIKGVTEAAKALHRRAVWATYMLTLLGRKNPDLVRELAQAGVRRDILFPHLGRARYASVGSGPKLNVNYGRQNRHLISSCRF